MQIYSEFKLDGGVKDSIEAYLNKAIFIIDFLRLKQIDCETIAYKLEPGKKM
jgi:hypothetical protein